MTIAFLNRRESIYKSSTLIKRERRVCLQKIKYPKKRDCERDTKNDGDDIFCQKKSSSPINRGAKRVVKHVLVLKE
jgi:hypothetical protein